MAESIWVCEACYRSIGKEVECFSDSPLVDGCQLCHKGKAQFHVCDASVFVFKITNVGDYVVDGKIVHTTNRRFVWRPKEDITTYELALCTPIFFSKWDNIIMLLELPDNARRHFEEVTK